MKITNRIRPITLSLILAAGTAVPLAGYAGQDSHTGTDEMSADMRDAWMEGKLETAFLFNRHLNNFTIDPEVNGSEAILTGTVASDVDRDLAEEIALSIDGIDDVDNDLVVKEGYTEESQEPDTTDSFANRVEDATLTAEVKLKLLANGNTEGMDINVDTENRVVTLEGEVETEARKALAEQIASNVDGVKRVDNNLRSKS